MKLRNKKSGNIIDVPEGHANNVLIPQGKYTQVVEQEPVKEAAPVEQPVKVAKKKPGRPRKNT